MYITQLDTSTNRSVSNNHIRPGNEGGTINERNARLETPIRTGYVEMIYLESKCVWIPKSEPDVLGCDVKVAIKEPVRFASSYWNSNSINACLNGLIYDETIIGGAEPIGGRKHSLVSRIADVFRNWLNRFGLAYKPNGNSANEQTD